MSSLVLDQTRWLGIIVTVILDKRRCLFLAAVRVWGATPFYLAWSNVCDPTFVCDLRLHGIRHSPGPHACVVGDGVDACHTSVRSETVSRMDVTRRVGRRRGVIPGQRGVIPGQMCGGVVCYVSRCI